MWRPDWKVVSQSISSQAQPPCARPGFNSLRSAREAKRCAQATLSGPVLFKMGQRSRDPWTSARRTADVGHECPPPSRKQRGIEPILAQGLKVISVGFLNPGDKPIIWRGPMLHQIIRQFLGSVEWGELDYLVIDLPPGTGDVALSLVQTVPLTGAVVVSTPSDVSLQDGRKAIEMFRQMKVDLIGMVENMSYFVCPHCQHEIDIFSRGGAEKTAQQFGVAFLGAIQLDPELRKGGDTGKPAVLDGENAPHAKALYEFARRVVARVDEIRAHSGDSVIQIQ